MSPDGFGAFFNLLLMRLVEHDQNFRQHFGFSGMGAGKGVLLAVVGAPAGMKVFDFMGESPSVVEGLLQKIGCGWEIFKFRPRTEHSVEGGNGQTFFSFSLFALGTVC